MNSEPSIPDFPTQVLSQLGSYLLRALIGAGLRAVTLLLPCAPKASLIQQGPAKPVNIADIAIPSEDCRGIPVARSFGQAGYESNEA